MSDPEPFSSAWWLDELGRKLDERDRDSERYERYYAGEHPFPLASRKFRDEFLPIFAGFNDNFCRLVIQAVEERLTVEGFRFGGQRADRQAWAIWQDNALDRQSQALHREALVKGEGLVIVAPHPYDARRAVIRCHEPEQVVLGYDDDPITPVVALRRWKDRATGELHATLYYADRLEKFRRDTAPSAMVPLAWVPRLVLGEPWPLPHDLGEVPVVAFPNDPDIDGEGTSEIKSVIPLQNALNKLLVDMLVSSEYGAFRQRWVTGMEIPTDPETGKPVEPFKAAVDRLWMAADAGAKMGEFEQTDLSNYTKAIELLIQHIASTTRTPPHYLLGQSGSFPSGESIKSTETGLVAKARRRMRDWGESWEQVMRLGLRATGNASAGLFAAAETKWKDPEVRTESEHVDALVKLGSIGVPSEQLWEDAGYSPQQIERFTTLRDTPMEIVGPDGSTTSVVPMPLARTVG